MSKKKTATQVEIAEIDAKVAKRVDQKLKMMGLNPQIVIKSLYNAIDNENAIPFKLQINKRQSKEQNNTTDETITQLRRLAESQIENESINQLPAESGKISRSEWNATLNTIQASIENRIKQQLLKNINKNIDFEKDAIVDALWRTYMIHVIMLAFVNKQKGLSSATVYEYFVTLCNIPEITTVPPSLFTEISRNLEHFDHWQKNLDDNKSTDYGTILLKRYAQRLIEQTKELYKTAIKPYNLMQLKLVSWSKYLN